MTRVALDSNVLIYAELEPESEKGRDRPMRNATCGL